MQADVFPDEVEAEVVLKLEANPVVLYEDRNNARVSLSRCEPVGGTPPDRGYGRCARSSQPGKVAAALKFPIS